MKVISLMEKVVKKDILTASRRLKYSLLPPQPLSTFAIKWLQTITQEQRQIMMDFFGVEDIKELPTQTIVRYCNEVSLKDFIDSNPDVVKAAYGFFENVTKKIYDFVDSDVFKETLNEAKELASGNQSDTRNQIRLIAHGDIVAQGIAIVVGKAKLHPYTHSKAECRCATIKLDLVDYSNLSAKEFFRILDHRLKPLRMNLQFLFVDKTDIIISADFARKVFQISLPFDIEAVRIKEHIGGVFNVYLLDKGELAKLKLSVSDLYAFHGNKTPTNELTYPGETSK